MPFLYQAINNCDENGDGVSMSIGLRQRVNESMWVWNEDVVKLLSLI